MRFFYLTALLVLSFLINTTSTYSQTSTTTVTYSGFQACGGCAVCGADYWCINTLGSYCGNTAGCDSKTFFDPVPAGHVVTNVTVNYWTASCVGASISGSINGFSVPITYDGTGGCLCDNNPCGLTTSSTGNYPCGMPGYVYGGNNSLQICTSTDMCINRAELVFTYVTPDAITPSITPSGPTSFCPGGSVVLDAGSGYSAYQWNTGATTQTITASSANTYTVSVTSVTGCTTGSSSATVTVYNNPTPTITGNTNYCTGASTTLNAGAYSSYIWSTGASTQTINASNVNNPITVTVTDGNGCVGSSAPINVNPLSLPTPSITGTLNYCSGGGTTLNAGGPYNQYSWSTGGNSQTTTATIANNPVTVTVTDANGCTGTSTGVYVSEYTNPTPVITGSLTYCPSSAASLDAGVYSSYLWSTGATSQTISATSANNPITVTVTDANGCVGVSPSISVSLAASLNPVITGSLTYCTGSSTTLNAGAYSTFLWSTGETTQTINATSANNPIYVTVTDAGGCTGSSAGINVSETPLPTPSITGNSSYCSGSSTTLSTGIYTSYLWSNGANTQTANVTIANNPVSVTVTDANGCDGVSTSVTLTEMTSPSPTINGVLSYCNGQSTTLNTGVASSYLWSTGAITQTITATVANNPITVTVTDFNGCSGVSNPVNVTLLPNLTPSITGSLTYCPGANTTLNAGTFSSYLWSTGSTSQSVTVTTTNNPITVTVTDASGCTGTATVNVSVNNPPSPTIIGPLTYCSSSNTTLTTGLYSNYLWSTGANTQTTTATASNNPVSVTVTDANGCTGTSSVTVTGYSIQSTVLSQTNVDCYSNSTGTLSISSSGGVTPYSFDWDNGDTTNTITNLSAGNYNVTITDNNNCQGDFTFTITQPAALSISTVVSDISCSNQNDGLIATTITGGTPNYQYQWSNNSTGATLGSLAAGNYSLTVTDSHNCSDSVLNITITNPPALVLTSNGVNPICYSTYTGSASATASGGTPPYTYSWTGGLSGPNVTNLNAGIYTVTVTDSHLCNTVNIVTLYNPLAMTLTDSVTISQNNTGNINLTVTGGALPYTYHWSNGATTEDLTGLSNGFYVVTVTDFNSCNGFDTIIINLPELPLIIPTVITPNNDNNNDDFEIKNIEQFKNVKIEIYNRWGDILFKFSGTCMEYKSAANRWNGKHNGKDLPMGSYVYIIHLDELDPYTGVCSIIR